MQTNLSVLLLGLVLTVPASGNTVCTTADGYLTYLDRQYAGGPPPPPDFEVGRTEWIFAGKPIFRSIQCTPGETPLPPDGARSRCAKDEEIRDPDLVVAFDSLAERVLYESPPDMPWQHVRKYLSKARVYRPSRNPIPDGTYYYEEFVICTYRRTLAP